MRRRRAVWLAWGIGGTSAGLAALNWALHAKNAAVPLPAIGEPLFAPPLFIVSRQPRNPVGWLLAAIGLGTGVADLAVEDGFYAVVTAPARSQEVLVRGSPTPYQAC